MSVKFWTLHIINYIWMHIKYIYIGCIISWWRHAVMPFIAYLYRHTNFVFLEHGQRFFSLLCIRPDRNWEIYIKFKYTYRASHTASVIWLRAVHTRWWWIMLRTVQTWYSEWLYVYEIYATFFNISMFRLSSINNK